MRLIKCGYLCLLFLFGGCASLPPGAQPNPDDPYERFNRAMYIFNDSLDRAILKPVATGYHDYIPGPIQSGIGNFFTNLGTPIDILNNLLQGKLLNALSDTGRLVINTTIGIGGLFDPAGAIGLVEHDEDFGQTLAVWGVPSGPYLVLPFVGPSGFRDGAGSLVDTRADPLYYYDENPEQYYLYALYYIDLRADLLQADDLLQDAFDPYAFIRDAYLQRREYLIYDGNPPPALPDYLLEDDWRENESTKPAINENENGTEPASHNP